MAVKPAGGPEAVSEDVAATGLFRVPVAARPPIDTLFRNTVEQAPVGIVEIRPVMQVSVPPRQPRLLRPARLLG